MENNIKISQEEKELRIKKIKYWTKRILLGIFCAALAFFLLFSVFAGWIQKND